MPFRLRHAARTVQRCDRGGVFKLNRLIILWDSQWSAHPDKDIGHDASPSVTRLERRAEIPVDQRGTIPVAEAIRRANDG
ncbi:hypothetical protein GCM10023209_24270 [Roseibacterium beibuensis]|uniref:Uncharacterized protein n=1 Tax=[Roseibacterium] beibuensis TaxID=1193142 RepID=A0ABP9LFE7_9RHOB